MVGTFLGGVGDGGVPPVALRILEVRFGLGEP